MGLSQQPSSRDKQFLKAIWSPRVPQKVKNLLWQACRCDRCHQALENPLHALWLCNELDIVWVVSELWDFRRTEMFLDFRELLSWIVMQGKNAGFFAFTCRPVWTQWNQVRLHKPASTLHQVPQLSKERLAKFISNHVSSTAQVRTATRPKCRWKPPPSPELVKINFDGAVFPSDNLVGIGVVIRDVRGSVIASCSKILPQAYSGVEVEALAAAMALSFASDIGISRPVLEGDSWVVIKALM